MEKNITSESLVFGFKDWMSKDIIEESSVGQLVSSHGIPKNFAKHIKSKCSNANSDFIVKIFLKNYKEMIENMTSESATDRSKMLSDNYINEFNRFMGYVGKTLDEYLKHNKGKKHKQEILELCDQGWTKFLKKMREYKKESLQETRINKTWKRKIKERARRNERSITPEDKKWAKKNINKWNKTYPELEEVYLKEIESAQEAMKASKAYLDKIRELRRKKIESKKNLIKPTPKELNSRPDLPPRPVGLNKHKEGPFYAGSFGPAENVVPELDLVEEENNE